MLESEGPKDYQENPAEKELLEWMGRPEKLDIKDHLEQEESLEQLE